LPMGREPLAQPPLGERTSPWFDQMQAAAAAPNVYAKLSGQFDKPAWTVANVRPYVDFALEQFGAHRIMFGSDWPVCILGGSYESVWANTNALISHLTTAEKAAILGGTASQFYQL